MGLGTFRAGRFLTKDFSEWLKLTFDANPCCLGRGNVLHGEYMTAGPWLTFTDVEL